MELVRAAGFAAFTFGMLGEFEAAKPELARSYVSYARLLNAKGKTEKAKEHFAKAVGMFNEMGMAWDLGRAEQALRES